MGVPLKPFINPLGGRPLHFTPKQLAEKFEEYINWCEENVMEFEEEESGYNHQGSVGKRKRLINTG